MVAGLDASLLFPGRPLIVEVFAFHLMRGRSHAPGEIDRENVRRIIEAGSVTHFF
jgi:hypothetical protein